MLTIVRTGSVCAALAAGLALAQTASAQEVPEGVTFEVTALNRHPVLEAVTQTLTLGDDGSIHGNAGCNTYSAGYVTMGDAILIQPPRVTRMACPEPQMDAERAFFATLTAVTSFTYDAVAGTLSLDAASGRPLMELRRQEP